MKQRIKRLLKNCILVIYRAMTVVLPIRPNTVVFMSNLGRSYGGNPKSIYEEMVAMGLDQKYHCYYLLENPKVSLPGKIRPIRISRWKYYYVMATAKVWVSDTRFPNYIKKRRNVTYIQTWHGTPLKKLALDMNTFQMAGGETMKEYQDEFKRNSATWDYLIAQNQFSADIFRRAFAFDKTIVTTGYPRNDILFQKNKEQEINQIREKLGIASGKKVILYAPTWRDNSFYDKASYRMNAPLDYDYLYESCKEDCVFLIKYHYMVRERQDFSKYKGFYQVMDSFIDISELYLVADVLITDYSSVMFDYSLLHRPMIFYVYDLKEYKEELRGFYFDFVKEAPGPLVTTTVELVEQIKRADFSEFKEAYQKFCKKYHEFEQGTAAKQIISMIKEILSN